jgi:hypothetical protein
MASSPPGGDFPTKWHFVGPRAPLRLTRAAEAAGPAMARCPPSPSSAVPMSASRPCSTGWSARSSPWSTTARRDPRPARGRGEPARPRFPGDRHGRLRGRGPATLPGRMRPRPAPRSREADAALFLIDARAGLTPLDEEIARWLRADHAGHPRRQQGRGPRRRERRHRGLRSGLGEPVQAISAEHGEGVADLFEHLRPHIEREEDRGERGRRRGAAQARHRRPPQCRQVDPDQPAARSGEADHRARGGDHPRFDRDRLGVAAPDGETARRSG